MTGNTTQICNSCGLNLTLPIGNHCPSCGAVNHPIRPRIRVIESDNRACLMCQNQCVDGQVLSDGTVYHLECYRNAQERVSALEQQSTRQRSELHQVQRQMDHEKSLGETIKRWFSSGKSRLPDLENRASEITIDSGNLNNELARCTESLSELHDYWLTYPPDWERRKSEIRRQSSGCANCLAGRGPLHVHHITPISRGGNHRLINLVLLCERCHSDSHNGQVFDENHDHDIGAYGKRLITLEQAINTRRSVRFHYVRADGQKTTRTIDPAEFKTVDWKVRPGDTLCVVGYCHLRKENRTFAIKRMSAVRMLSED